MRRDLVTGEKINKLRKSYEGKAKNLGLPGRNKPTTIPGELTGFLEWPSEMWADQRAEPIKQTTDDVLAKLDRALAMAPGRLPTEEHNSWKSYLGIEDGPAAAAGKGTPSLAPTKNAAQMLKNNASMRASAPASPRAAIARPDRANKKRRYDDSSFEGYREEDDGYSTGGLDDMRVSGSKKRKKVS